MITQLTGNGRILLTLNEAGEWNDLFYPYPGEFQHLRESRLGLYDVADRKFSWLRVGGPFEVTQVPESSTTVPETQFRGMGVDLRVLEHIHPNHDLIVRVIRVSAPEGRKLRLFSYHSFKIEESMYQETAYVDPELHSVVHYKRSFYFELFSDPGFDSAVCGEHTLKGLRGTYVDAEDGLLEGRTISHGAADSALQWNIVGAGTAPVFVRMFVALGRQLDDTRRLREYVRAGDPARFEREARAFWGTWTARHPVRATPGLEERARRLYQASVHVMRHVSAQNGSIIASPDTTALVIGGDTYNYCWWRDGGYISKAMDEAGLYDNARRFLRFAAQCQRPDGSFLHRHFPDGTFGSTWHPPPFLQIDQTGTVIAAVWHHFKLRAELEVLLDHWPMVKNAAEFLRQFRDLPTGLCRPSFDLWEEREAINTYSVAVVIHALERAFRIARELGKDGTPWHETAEAMHESALRHLWSEEKGMFLRSINPRDERIDASVLLALKLGLLDWADPRAARVVDTIERRLWNPTVGGVARYEGDEYYGRENPWIICTLWLAEARLMLGDKERCRALLDWVVQHATASSLLPEQVDAQTGESRSAVPLAWSHSTFVDVVHKYQRAMRGAADDDE
ncbi:MAG TPA: glycoside hydrolase family 15 protein [Thermoplasmata archaeon]|nr:glycoside hydrolase family 15 protein [Thermoplasmata archaeon]